MTDGQNEAVTSSPECESKGRRSSLVSIVTPAFNEAENLPELYKRLLAVMEQADVEWEWIVIDDHSTDDTFAVLRRLTDQDPRIRGLRFSRNFGSHMAITCGLNQANGDCALVMAADLQDPPEELPPLLAEWRAGAQVVWAARASREGEKASTLVFSRLYWMIMNNVVGTKQIPVTGADFFLLDRVVVDAFLQFKESNVSVVALITWMGFKQTTIKYHKQARMSGHSGWTLGKKVKIVLDSVMSFSYLPIRLMTLVGFAAAAAGLIYGGLVVGLALFGTPIQGWSSLMIAVLFFGGVQMIMMGVLGEYLWRTLTEARQRPRYIIEAVVGH
jgi:dolichol-phosphate mannosyltransferase